MGSVGVIASVVAAIAAVLTLVVIIRNTKASILRRIDSKERHVQDIENYQCRKYGLNRRSNVITPLDEKKHRLQSEINELRRRL